MVLTHVTPTHLTFYKRLLAYLRKPKADVAGYRARCPPASQWVLVSQGAGSIVMLSKRLPV